MERKLKTTLLLLNNRPLHSETKENKVKTVHMKTSSSLKKKFQALFLKFHVCLFALAGKKPDMDISEEGKGVCRILCCNLSVD